jgi:hypothetical protein
MVKPIGLTTCADVPALNQMVEGSGQPDAEFRALAHDVRRERLRRLASRELTVGELAEPLDMSLAAASKHQQVHERAGLVRRTVTAGATSAGAIPAWRSVRPASARTMGRGRRGWPRVR